MAENQANPLSKYFRQPVIYVKLPSGGKGYPPGAIDMPPNGELPIYPMTALDEIMSRTPDALYNGSATVDIFKSCVPNIRDPWAISQSDVDLLLIAIRIASYGHEMDMGSTCPKCNERSDFSIDLRNVLDKIKPVDYAQPLSANGLTIFFNPMTYKELNANAIRQFEEQKALTAADNPDMAEEDKQALLQRSLANITSLTIDSLVTSITVVQMDDTPVSDKNQIREFLVNCDRNLFAQIRDHIVNLRAQGELEPLQLTCPECKNQYQQSFTLDQANFFG